MLDNEILEMYKPLVTFIAQFCGPSCEVVLHNLNDPKRSIIAIENGHYSKRSIGDPLTDFGMEILNRGLYKNSDYLINYKGYVRGKEFKSSTYFIKNGDEKIIGMLCLNSDVTPINDLDRAITNLKRFYNLKQSSSGYRESLDAPVDSILHDMIHNAIQEYDGNISLQDRIDIIQKLKKNGVLAMKGGIAEVAKQLNVSEPTIYRYMHK
ncbi:MAG: PAS domain-containing protein [Erysipelotrichaceae bacterium]|nr:PAS domain-containing protein [Erysipelotrichaceae bacterium]MDY6035196.1 PAS domain-containing protein [Bulleidia sp.]